MQETLGNNNSDQEKFRSCLILTAGLWCFTSLTKRILASVEIQNV